LPVRPRIVVFDLGGVLIRICRSWRECCIAAGLPVRDESASVAAARQALAERYNRGEIDCESFFRLAAEAMNGAYTVQEVRRAQHALLVAEYPGASALIEDVRRVGLATGILSNTNHGSWWRQRPRRDGGTGEFLAEAQVDHPHASHLMGLLKPGEAIYRAFERASGYRGDLVLFFDDMQENIDTAIGLGWQAELIDHTGDTAAQVREHLRSRGVDV
jgi:glucose-1-phosphatase